MSNVENIKAKVQRILTESLGSVRVDNNGSFIVTYNSAVAFVRVEEGFGDDGVLLHVTCPLVVNVPITDELCRWIATEGQKYKIGSTSLVAPEGATEGMVIMRQSLIAEDLDRSELIGTLVLVINSSDSLDNEIQERFGGELFSEQSGGQT